MEKDIRLSILIEANSLYDWLIDLGYSGRQIKKVKLSKKFQNTPARRAQEVSLPIDLINFGKVNPRYSGPEIELVHENEWMMAFNKPSALHCHPLLYSETDTFLNFLCHSRPKLLQVAESDHERGLLYRIDRDTSGLLIYIKNTSVHRELRKNFSSLCKRKVYSAVVQGKISKELDLEHFLAASGSKGSKVLATRKEQAKLSYAHLKLRPLLYNEDHDLSLVGIILYEGHRHQIRAQLSEYGSPILGDQMYGGKASERLFLHCYAYKILWEEEEYHFKAETMPLFHRFFDLDTCSEMLSDMFLSA